MKKRLEAELISIAHRILKLKNKSEIDSLYKETRKLYEALSVLKFYEDNYSLLKNEISKDEIEQKTAAFIEQEEKISEEITPEETVIIGEIIIDDSEISEEAEEEVLETEIKESENEDDFKPAFELSFDDESETEEINETIEEIIEETTAEIEEKFEEIKEEIPVKTEKKQVTLHDIFGDDYTEPVFVKPAEIANDTFISVFDKDKKKETEESKVVSLNDVLSNSISISLNDRVAFVKHLFNESNEDYNRVLSQLNTFNTFAEAKEFLNEMVIPDYNFWVGKEEYLERFMEIVEKKFN